MAIQPDLVELIRCPKCHGELTLSAAGDSLTCGACKLVYAIIDDIPQLLIEEAKSLAS
jgi:uncharacterized protein YbaR (Trm112 family)